MMNSVLRHKSSTIWLILMGMTTISWTLGSEQASADRHILASILIIAVAVFKIRLVGLYFMDLKAAPGVLRKFFEGYCAVLLAVLSGMYLLV